MADFMVLVEEENEVGVIMDRMFVDAKVVHC